QAEREVVERHHRAGLVAEGLEKMRRDRRARQLDEDLSQARQALGLAHGATGVSAQCVRARFASSPPPGMGSMGPTSVRCRTTPCLSTRNMPWSSAEEAWWWRRRRKLRFITSK